MGKLNSIFKKHGGFDLIKQYWRGGAFFTAVNQFIVLGHSRTALEFLAESAQLKLKENLERKYRNILDEFEEKYIDKEHNSSNKIWFCWFQGIENAPDIVKKCYQSLIENIKDKEIIVITSENMFEYVQFPEYILEKWKKGYITNTHLSDLLRLELLIKYGGTWIDSTVYCSDNNIPRYFFESDLFFYQCLKPGRDGHSNYISSWFISAKTNNKILLATRELLYSYWKKNNQMVDYFLLHDFMSIVLDKYQDEWNKIIPRDNATPHELLLRLFDEYDEGMWNAIKNQTPFHKLTYKFTNEDKTDTYYAHFLKNKL